MKKLSNSKFFKPFGLVLITAILIGAASLYQQKVLQVQAAVQVLLVSNTAISYGSVFPGEELNGEFQILLDDSASHAVYIIRLHALPRQLDLCPHLEILNMEGEDDTVNRAFLNRGASDLIDRWIVALKVPGIEGNISQDHDGKIIITGGDYTCMIKVVLLQKKSR